LHYKSLIWTAHHDGGHFEQLQFGTAGVEGVNNFWLHGVVSDSIIIKICHANLHKSGLPVIVASNWNIPHSWHVPTNKIWRL